MEIGSSQELYVKGIAMREKQKIDLTISPERAGTVRAARHQAATADYGTARSDGIGEALAEAERSGRNTSFLEFYQGPLSEKVLSDLLEAGTLQPGAT
jgi:hypothetical protein